MINICRWFFLGLYNIFTIIPRYLYIGIMCIIDPKRGSVLKYKGKPIIPITMIGLTLTTYFICIFVSSRWYVQQLKINYLANDIKESTKILEDEEELNQTLQKIYDAGYDGKIGISYDNFHGQDYKKIRIFCAAVNKIFDEESINIQAVADPFLDDEKTEKLESELNALGNDFSADIFVLPQTFQSDDKRGWQSKKWFKEDFCEGPGNILFVHADENIAPCCGFANENCALFIGKITDSFDSVMQNAEKNPMIKLCFEKGLSSLIKKLEKEKKLPGKTGDICTFCDFIAKMCY